MRIKQNNKQMKDMLIVVSEYHSIIHIVMKLYSIQHKTELQKYKGIKENRRWLSNATSTLRKENVSLKRQTI